MAYRGEGEGVEISHKSAYLIFERPLITKKDYYS